MILISEKSVVKYGFLSVKTIFLSIKYGFLSSKYVHKFNINRTVTTDGVSTPEDEELFLNIPRGINSGQTITLADKGNISNGAKGQLNVHVKVKNESIFKRDGLNLIYNTKITLIEALCGFSHEFTHVSGAKLCL